MFGKILARFRKNPFLVVLCLALTVISVGMIRPDFYLIGWDNYSSYFNLKTNLFRTLFATWREYRGLGVASDAEVTDVFRLILQWLLHFFVREELLDQVYYVASLWVGVLSVYCLARFLFRNYIEKKKDHFGDVFGGLASLFYLFNLNTLSVFYSPIIPFTNRFWGLPLTLYLLLKFEEKKSIKNLVWLLMVVFFSCGSYITPTVVITSLIALVLFGLFQLNLKKTILYGLIFVVLNAFWILPFANYVIEKSSIVPLARTFIEINESMLNKSELFFSIERQSILWPSFLDMKFGSISRQIYTIHPLLNNFLGGWGRKTLFLFPVIYGLGSLLLLFGFKKNKKLLWIPGWIIVFLFLSTNKYGPLGFIYSFLAKKIPYFEMIFRIGDTKFHSYVALAGSIAGAYFIYSLIEVVRKVKIRYLVWGVVGLIMGWYVYQFRAYVGNMMGFFVYTKIPGEYRQMARIINEDENEGRVLHLPLAWGHEYWKSHSWGYLGSAWFNYLLDKPYIDKTFEPASMENVYLDAKIGELLDRYATAESEDKDVLAKDFLKLISLTGVRYVIVDHTIDSSVYTRDVYYNSKQYVARASQLMKYLADNGLVEEVSNFDVNMDTMSIDYEKLYPVNKTGLPGNTVYDGKIELYRIKEAKPMFLGMGQVSLVEVNFDNFLETDLVLDEETVMQKDIGRLVPFVDQGHSVSINEGQVELRYEVSSEKNDYIVKKKPAVADSSMMDVFAKMEEEKLVVSIYDRYLPDINGQEFRREVGLVGFGYVTDLSLYRLKIGEVFLTMPQYLSTNTYIDSVMTHGPEIEVGLYYLEELSDLNLTEFNKTDPLPCFGPELSGYEAGVDIQADNIKMVSSRGGTCVARIVKLTGVKEQYVEANIRLKSISDGDQAMRGYVCLYEGESKNCLNNHRQLRLYEDWTEYVIRVENQVSGQTDLKLEIGSIPGGSDSQDMDIGEVELKSFIEKDSQSIEYKKHFGLEKVNLTGELKIGIPKAKSNYSYFHNKLGDMFTTPQEMCPDGNPRKIVFEGDVIKSSMNNCSVYFAQPFLYATEYPYLIAFDYMVSQGQQPNIVIGQSGDDFLVERVSLYQGYPYTEKGKMVEASRLIAPNFRSGVAIKEATAHVFQDTEGRGEMAVGDLLVMEYPSDWHDMELIPEGNKIGYTETKVVDFKRILPSWWWVKIEASQAGKALIRFGQGYDRQWGIYKNGLDMILGKSVGENSRCDGWANCFEVDIESGDGQFYVFYWPEVLATAGWILSLSTAVALICFKRWKR